MKMFKFILKSIGLYNFARELFKFSKSLSPERRRKKKKEIHQKALWKKFYQQFINNGDLCFDIGANVGVRTQIFKELGARVVMAEPNQECISILKKKFRKDPHVWIIEKGVGEKECRKEFFVSSGVQVSSFSSDWIESIKPRLSKFEWQKAILAPVTTMNKLIEEFGIPDFCKIDVEGYELEVLNGLDIGIPKLSFEFTPERLEPAKYCIEKLDSLGDYEYNYSYDQTTIYEINNWVSGKLLFSEFHKMKQSKKSGDIYAMKKL